MMLQGTKFSPDWTKLEVLMGVAIALDKILSREHATKSIFYETNEQLRIIACQLSKEQCSISLVA